MPGKLRLSPLLFALAVVVVATAIAAFFVPTVVSLPLVGIAIALIALGALTLARRRL